MKFNKKIIITFLVSMLCSYSGVFAAGLDHFEVKFTPDSAKIGEALDLSIKAVDKNGEVVKDYNGTILIFSESDPEAELPIALEDNTYTFSLSEQGSIQFENSVKFKESGTQNIHIYDLNDDTVFGIGEAEIIKEAIQTSVEISIISPENGLTIGEDFINISGTTNKNHQVKVIVNNENEQITTSDGNGIFELQVKNLQDGKNTFKAQILNSESQVIGESSEITTTVELNSINIKNVKVIPESIESETSFEIEVIANAGLTNVEVIINDVISSLTESTDGKYTAKLYAPKEIGTYSIDIQLKDELGHNKKELGASNLIVIEPELNVAKTPNTTKKPVDNNDPLKVKGLKLVELKSKSVLTWEKIEGVESYNIYKKSASGSLELIENVTESKFEIELLGDNLKYDYFAVKAVAKSASGELYEGSLSDATKVKTGPEILILILLSLCVGGAFFLTSRRRA